MPLSRRLLTWVIVGYVSVLTQRMTFSTLIAVPDSGRSFISYLGLATIVGRTVIS